jgi:serine/threonine protein phosphatase PrpC
VCDGHGLYGKEVSEFIKAQLAQNVEKEIKNIFD